MRRPRSAARTLAVTVRPLVARMSVALLLAGSLGLLFAGHGSSTLPERLRGAISDTVVPVLSVLAKPVDSLTAVSTWVSQMATLKKDNNLLASENARLQQWQAVATELSAENEKLRALLKFAPTGKQSYTSARVAADMQSPYAHSVIITSGSDQNVQEDLPVVSDAGLVGRVVDVSRKTSRVLLLTDMNSRIPVISEDSREHAIAGGNNSETLSLIYLPENSKLKVGEKIITSGDGAVLPPGLPVGVITGIEKNTATVKPYMDADSLDYVSVLDSSK